MDKKIALENLAALELMLAERGMRAWLDGGSLLGCYREGHLIDHDEDTDLGMHIADWQREPALDFLRAMKAAGFTILRYFGEVEHGLEITLERRGVRTDLFFYYPAEDRVWCGGWVETFNQTLPGNPPEWTLIKYFYERFELRTMLVNGVELYVPADTEKYLISLYGASWNIPDPAWHGMSSPPNAMLTNFSSRRDPAVFVEADFLERALPGGPRARVPENQPEGGELLRGLQMIEALGRRNARKLAAAAKKAAEAAELLDTESRAGGQKTPGSD
jgi:hypothetical protein